MNGANLRSALENSLWFAGKPSGRFAHLSGLRVHANGKAVPGRRIKSLTIGGKPVNPGRRDKVAKILIGETDGPLISNIVMAYIQERGVVASKTEGRIVID
jgi:5'-nucleotidase/UDP-sugar diphosphatase